MGQKGFFDKPKLLKEDRYWVRWPFILVEQEGASFNPIRPQGCLHYIALFVFWFLFLGITFGAAQFGWYLFVEAWTYLAQSFATLDSATVITGVILLGLAGSATMMVSAFLGDVHEGTKRRRKKIHPAYTRIGRGKNRRAP